MSVDWTKFDYANDLQFDIDSLELEAQDHPAMGMKYAEEKARVYASMKRAKENIGVVKSQVTRDFISSASKKPTVAEIEAEVSLNEDYRKAVDEHLQLEYEYELLKEACSSMRDRKEMIQETVKLLAMNYFTRVSVTNGYRKIDNVRASKASEETRAEMNEKMRSRRRKDQ